MCDCIEKSNCICDECACSPNCECNCYDEGLEFNICDKECECICRETNDCECLEKNCKCACDCCKDNQSKETVKNNYDTNKIFQTLQDKYKEQENQEDDYEDECDCDCEESNDISPIELDIDNVINTQFDEDEFKKGVNSISFICGQITGLINVGIPATEAIGYVMNNEVLKQNKDVTILTGKNNLEIAKARKIAIEKNEI